MARGAALARLACAVGRREFASKAGKAGAVAKPSGTPSELVSEESLAKTTITKPGQAFVGDLRSTSGLGLGDGLETHTSKWLQTDVLTGNSKSPMEWIQEAEPIKVHGAVVASYGTDDPALGCPAEYISLKGTSKENPAVCKYTGNKYYSDDWHLAH